jgi:ABC-type transport system involved in multi-copper enzyme maturation permease subunit
MRFTQLGGLIRYEMRLQWRQRMLTGVILSLIALPLIMYALFGQNNAAEVQRTWITTGGIATAAALTVTTRYAVMYGAMALYVVMLLVLPVVSADVIAKDRHYGVRELVEGLPLTTGTYLAGKLLGWWAAAGSGLALALIAVGAGMWILIGPYHLAQFAGTWLAFGWGIGLINSGLSLLLAASQPTRRRAIISGVVFAALCLFANISLIGRSEPLWNLLSPGRQAISMHFMLEAWRDQVIAQIVPTADVLWALLGGVLEVVVVGTIVWAWMKRRNE